MEIKEADFRNRLSRNQFDDYLQESPSPFIDDSLITVSRLKEDLWSFGYFWPEIVEKFSTVEELYAALQEKSFTQPSKISIKKSMLSKKNIVRLHLALQLSE